MKFCPTCKSTYADDANFCPQETCATPQGPQRLVVMSAVPAPASVAAAPLEAKSRFQLGPRIGGGNTGDVYRATDTVTGAQVAYKVVSSDVLPNAAAFARAERELKQLMRVHSPRIATVIDCGRAPDERLYVALELCEGESLDRALRGEPVPLDRAKAIVGQVGQALLEAQKAGIVHRDVAPKNVILMPSGDIKVINFPLAKPLNERAAGVAAYLSPEQVQGKPVDQRSNTYNLAALLYHLLTGEPPFQGTAEQVLELHVSSPPLAPSQRRPEANLPPEVDRVILKALDKSSSRRHLTLRLFLSEVESLVAPTVAPAATGAGKEPGGGFARTMLFAGGQAEVANLVAKAIASRGGSPAHGVPIAAPQPAGATVIGTPGSIAPAVTPTPVSPSAAAIPRRHQTPAGAPVMTPPPQSLGTAATIAVPPPASAAPVRAASPAAGVPVNVPPASNSAPIGANRTIALDPQKVAQAAAANTGNGPVATPPAAAPPAASPPVAASAPPAHAAAGNAPATATPSGGTAAASANGAGSGGPRPAPKGDAGKGAAFRETLWFKKGDVEHMIAEARAKIAGPEGKVPPEAPSPTEEVLPIEDRYVDDGTLTAEDRKKFSLRTNQTAASLPVVKGKVVPGESMSEAEVLREVSGGSRRVIVLLVVVVLVLAAGAAVLTLMRSKSPQAPAPPPTASAIPAPPASATTAARPSAPKPATDSKGKKLVATPPNKRDDDKRATRRKSNVRKRR